MNLTRQDFFDVFTPLLLALHEKKVIDIAELPHHYEDVLARRKLDRKEEPEALAFLEHVTSRLHNLARQVKQGESGPDTRLT